MPARQRRCGGARVMSRPSSRIAPASGDRPPAIRLNSVDLAGAVRPDDADRLARRDREIDVVGDDDRAEGF